MYLYFLRADYQRISEEIKKRGREMRRPPPFPPGDPRIGKKELQHTLQRPPPRDRERLATVVHRPHAAEPADFNVSYRHIPRPHPWEEVGVVTFPGQATCRKWTVDRATCWCISVLCGSESDTCTHNIMLWLSKDIVSVGIFEQRVIFRRDVFSVLILRIEKS